MTIIISGLPVVYGQSSKSPDWDNYTLFYQADTTDGVVLEFTADMEEQVEDFYLPSALPGESIIQIEFTYSQNMEEGLVNGSLYIPFVRCEGKNLFDIFINNGTLRMDRSKADGSGNEVCNTEIQVPQNEKNNLLIINKPGVKEYDVYLNGMLAAKKQPYRVEGQELDAPALDRLRFQLNAKVYYDLTIHDLTVYKAEKEAVPVPDELRVEDLTHESLTLYWDWNDSSFDSTTKSIEFEIRSKKSGESEHTVHTSARSLYFSELIPQSEYLFNVAAIVTDLESGTQEYSEYSDTLEVKTMAYYEDKPDKPGQPEIEKTGVISAKLSWEFIDKAEYYNIYRVNADGSYELLPEQYQETEAVLTGLMPGVSYRFLITAVNSEGESDYSDAAEITMEIPNKEEIVYSPKAYEALSIMNEETFSSGVFSNSWAHNVGNPENKGIFTVEDDNWAFFDGSSELTTSYRFPEQYNKPVISFNVLFADVQNQSLIPYVQTNGINVISILVQGGQLEAVNGLLHSPSGKDEFIKLGPIETDVWHNIRLELDISDKSYNLYMDGELLAESFGFRTNVEAVNMLRLSVKNGATNFIDDIQIYQEKKLFLLDWKQDSHGSVLDQEIHERETITGETYAMAGLNPTEDGLVCFWGEENPLLCLEMRNGNLLVNDEILSNGSIAEKIYVVFNSQLGTYDLYTNGSILFSGTAAEALARVQTSGIAVDRISVYINEDHVDITDYEVLNELERLEPLVDNLSESSSQEKLKKASLSWGISNTWYYYNRATDEKNPLFYEKSRLMVQDIDDMINKDIGYRDETQIEALLNHGMNLYPEIPKLENNPFVPNMFHDFLRFRDADEGSAYELIMGKGKLAGAAAADVATAALAGSISFAHPQSHILEDPQSLTALLTILDSRMDYWSQGGLDFMEIFEMVYSYAQLSVSYPDLIPPSKKADWEKTINEYMQRTIEEFGQFWKDDNMGRTWYNAEVRYALALYVSGCMFDNQEYIDTAKEAFEGILLHCTQPDGGINYVGYANEVFTYHVENIEFLGWYYLFTGDENVRDEIKKTVNYYPLNMEDGKSVTEYYTAVSWKQYWNMSKGQQGAYIVASLTGDGHNYRAFMDNYRDNIIIVPFFYRDDLVEWKAPKNYLLYDRNIMGPRANYGDFAYAASSRNPQPAEKDDGTLRGVVPCLKEKLRSFLYICFSVFF